MPRIRSTHPGQWTDHEFLACSPLCRLLVLALRNESDDNGIFKWNLVEIKIRCLPLDNIDIKNLLDEAIENNQLKQFDHGGKKYGIIRNFTQWQRPKSPTFLYPVPIEMEKDYELNKAYFGSETQLNLEGSPNSSAEVVKGSEERGNGKNKPLSSKHDTKLKNTFKKDAKDILEFLNDKTGRRYPPVDSNIDLIVNRLKEGYTVTQIRQVIALMVRKWGEDDKMKSYTRPKTLFNKTNLANYVGELGA